MCNGSFHVMPTGIRTQIALPRLDEHPWAKRMELFVKTKIRAAQVYFSITFLLSLLGACGLPAYGQQREQSRAGHDGLMQDWSRHHVVFPRVGPLHSLIAAGRDPRAILSWQEAIRRDWHRERDEGGDRDRERNNEDNDFQPKHRARRGLHHDWSISLGAGGTSPAMYPAKFSFDVNAAPDCTNDFVVYPINAPGTSTQPNLVGFNNLYSGTSGSTGICNRADPPSGDDGVSATTLWSYDIQAAGGQVTTSPALSLDGTKVAFVETGASTRAHFHVLAWRSGDGVDLLTPNAQNVLLPVVITGPDGFLPEAPAAGSGTVTDLALGSTVFDSDTLSSPFVDYTFDYAYVGNDNGTLFRIQDVFCTVNPACSGGTPPAPTLDATWGTAGALSVCPGFKMSGPVEDAVTGNVFVGCADGALYGFTSNGTPLAGSPMSVGDGSATGGIVDPPLVDAVNGFVYVVTGSSAGLDCSGGTAILVQAKTADMSSPQVATLGAGGLFNLHDPDFNDAYFSSLTSTDWLLYAFAANAGGTAVALYGASFEAGHNMTPGTPSNVLTFPIGGPYELSPATEFLSGGEDRIFNNALHAPNPNFTSLNINSFPTVTEHAIDEGGADGGTSGIVVDNVSASAQAASIYFSVLSTNMAVKLTQSGLN